MAWKDPCPILWPSESSPSKSPRGSGKVITMEGCSRASRASFRPRAENTKAADEPGVETTHPAAGSSWSSSSHLFSSSLWDDGAGGFTEAAARSGGEVGVAAGPVAAAAAGGQGAHPVAGSAVEAAALEAEEQAAVGDHDMKPKDFIGKLDENHIVAAIAAAEKRTSGELRVWISEKERADALAAARERFAKLGMQKTKHRNAVLIYFAPVSRQFAIWGDTGVHEKCGDNFWKGIAAGMTRSLKEEKYTDAVVFAVKEVGEVLARHFPREPDD